MVIENEDDGFVVLALAAESGGDVITDVHYRPSHVIEY